MYVTQYHLYYVCKTMVFIQRKQYRPYSMHQEIYITMSIRLRKIKERKMLFVIYKWSYVFS